MSFEPPVWHPFDPDAPVLPSRLDVGGSEEGDVVVLLDASEARPDGTSDDIEPSREEPSWGARAAISLVRRWSEGTERLFLMDLELDEPALHRVLGLENGEGASDVVLFGSSIQRVAHPVDRGSFYFASAGTPTGDPEGLLRHERWDRLLRGFRDAGARLVLYLPEALPGAGSLAEKGDRIVVLGRPGRSRGGTTFGPERSDVVRLRPPVTEERAEPSEAGPDEATGPIVDIAELAPDEPVVDIAELAPDEPVVEIRELAPDEPVVDIAELAPDSLEALSASGSQDLGGPDAAEEPPAPGDTETAGTGGRDAERGPDPEAQDPFDMASLDALTRGVEHEDSWDGPGEPAATAGADEVSGPAGSREPTGLGDLGGAPSEPGGLEDPEAAGEEEEEPSEPEEEAPARGFDDFTGEVADETEPEDEVPAPGFDDFAGEVAGETEPEEGTGRDEVEEAGTGAFDFGGFSGELEEDDPEATGPDEAEERAPPEPEGLELEPSFAERQGGAADPDEAADDFGGDLVTGADFGGGPAPEEGSGPDASGPDASGPGEGEPPGAAAATARTEDAAQRPQRPAEGPGATREGEGDERTGGPRAEPAEPVRDRTSGRPVRLVLLLLLLAGAVGAGHWFGIVQVPGLNDLVAELLGPAAVGPAPVVQPTDPTPSTAPLDFSLAVDEYRDPRAAGEVASALRERLPGHLFVVAPVQEGGEVLHRLLAGPARSPDEARILRDVLAGVLTREDPEAWSVRSTPLAFLLEETSSASAARTRAATLGEQGVWAYVLQVRYPDESVRYRVYAGAYETAEEARALQGMLAQAGISDALFTERRGRLPE